MIYATLYNPSIDLIYPVKDLVHGSTYTGINSRSLPAGKGLNFTKVVHALGEPVSLCAIMPEYDEQRFRDYLDQIGIDYLFITVPGSARINTTIIEESSGCVTHFNSMGTPLSPRIQDHFFEKISPLIKKNDIWAFSGSLPNRMDDDAYRIIIEEVHKRGATPLLDTSGMALKHGIQARPSVLTPNEAELEWLVEEPVSGIRHLVLKGKRFIDAGVEMLFITLGADGVVALTADECLICNSPEVDVVDTVGCGDAFLAGVAVAKARGFSFHETCRLAVACGASNASKIGPGEIDPDQVWSLMEKAVVSDL